MGFSKGEIDRLGSRVRLEGFELSELTLNDLQNHRTSYKDSLAKTFNILCTLTKQIDISSIVTYRIKRFESIIGKLRRIPDMRFSRMWDIGGCRCIMKTNKDVYRLRDLIETRLQIVKSSDYITAPQSDGYRSLHLYVRLPDDNKIIELQIRNQIDHSWATLVEITDLLFDSKIKEYNENEDNGGHEELSRFHLLLSRREALDINEKREVAKLIRKHKYFEKLSDVFSRNHVQVRQQWLSIENKSNHKYFLIETNKKEVPKIESFQTFNDAETSYLNVYKSKQSANVVLTHLPKPSYSQISIAYSNYILTFHTFLDDCYDMLEDVILDSLDRGKVIDFTRYFYLYQDTAYNHIKNLASEIKEVNKLGKGSFSNKRLTRKEKEWITDINKEIIHRQNQQNNFNKALSNHFPRKWVNRFFINSAISYVDAEYRLKFKKVLKSLSE